MAISLYNEALNAAEELKLAVEEKAKKQLIEAMSPQIKLLVEQNLMLEVTDDVCGVEYAAESDESLNSKDEDESLDSKEDNDNPATKDGDVGDKNKLHGTQLENHELSSEATSVISKLISASAKKSALKKKIEEISRNIKVIKKAKILAESGKGNNQIKKRINLLYKNLVAETRNIISYDIFKKDKVILKEFYNIVKELNNMSRRRSKEFLNENLEDLLEMNLFEEDDDQEPEEPEETEETEESEDLDQLEDMTSEGSDDVQVTSDTTVEDLAKMAGLLDEVDTEGDDLDDIDDELGDIDDETEELPEGLWETDDNIEDNHEENLSAGHVQDSYQRSGDVFLEIDESMLKKEISKMKRLREGEAKDMASHFGGGSLEKEAFVDGIELNKLHEIKIKAAKVVRKNRMLESKLTQYKKALRGMKGQLSEMNLFNAKLLYANKLMQNRDLTIKQQRNIVESLDEAKTLGEAKILFESLTKSLVRPVNTRNKNLSEGAVRKTMSSSSRPVRSAQNLNESVALNRWATLAGIKK